MIPVIRIYLLYLQTQFYHSRDRRHDIECKETRLQQTSYLVPQKQILGDLKIHLATEMSQNNVLTYGKLRCQTQRSDMHITGNHADL